MTSLWVKDNQNFERSCMITCALSGVVANRAQCAATGQVYHRAPRAGEACSFRGLCSRS